MTEPSNESSNELEIEQEFKFIKSEDHENFMSNRVWGGVQNSQLFELNFLLEHKPTPESVTEELGPEGSKEVNREQTDEVVRENQATIYMTISTMISLYNWLEGKIEELEDKGVLSRESERG